MKKCRFCGSTRIIKYGVRTSRTGTHQLWKCQHCGRVRKGGKVR